MGLYRRCITNQTKGGVIMSMYLTTELKIYLIAILKYSNKENAKDNEKEFSPIKKLFKKLGGIYGKIRARSKK